MKNPSAAAPALLGYCDPLSARPGQQLSFRISSLASPSCQLSLKRIICADPNPDGPGIIEQDCDEWLAPVAIAVREQRFFPGSCALGQEPIECDLVGGLIVDVRVFPTLESDTEQVIFSCGPLVLGIAAGQLPFVGFEQHRVQLPAAVATRQWHHLVAGFDVESDDLFIRIKTSDDAPVELRRQANDIASSSRFASRACVGARWCNDRHIDHFNGKIESPGLRGSRVGSATIADWDFSREMSTDTVLDTGPNAYHLSLINSPTRAVTGSAWDGSEMCWRHQPSHYAAIHFHQDDIYDFGWLTDFVFTVPEGMPSGIYALRLDDGENTDSVPFFICPPRGKPSARLCVLVPTFTYAIYGNHARPDFEPSWLERNKRWGAYPHNPAVYRQYGLSTYNNHADGSGICHASHLRPLFNLRPGYLTFGNTPCSGLRHLQADSHLISWLHDRAIDYDIITDRELHEEGMEAIAGYAAVTTTSHPEYHTTNTLDALKTYTAQGGNLLYLGGNGFYWRIAIHPERPDLLEIRRAEDGIRAWAAEPGEYYNAFDGAYGGLWRRNGRPPQQLAGVGFSAQGSFYGSYYRRKCFDPQFDWLFEGVEGDKIGDFGLCGNGAAGFELDRVDTRLGSPRNLTVLASSEGHDDGFVLVPEEQLTHITNIPGEPEASLLRADMVYFDVPGGGSVFSVGSITFCGSLPVNDFENDVSRLLGNVIHRMTANHDGKRR